MARRYTKSKRAEQQADTRRRIAEAALALHGIHGPARTTFSMVAEKAKVQRHTLYAHFPDEWSLGLACSGLHLEQHPPPQADEWEKITDRRVRLVTALQAIYRWFEQNAALFACVMRDAEYHDVTRRIADLRFGPPLDRWRDVLGAADQPPAAKAMLELALSFHSWRTLANCGLSSADAASRMTSAVLALDA